MQRMSGQRVGSAFALWHEPEILNGENFGDGETIVYFRELDVTGAQAGHLVRFFGCTCGPP